MRSPANQRRRSRRNRQPSTPANRERPSLIFTPKLTYANSSTKANGLFVVSKRKRAPPTAEEIERRKQKKREVKIKQVQVSTLRHEVVALYKYGMHNDNFDFKPGSPKDIILFLQATYPQYEKKEAAQSFVYRAIKRHKNAAAEPHLNPHRDRRGENRKKTKRDNPAIVQLCDELLSEPGATAPKVREGLGRHGHNVSLSTIHRIAKDLSFRWTKPWYTDVLTPAQKFKRKLFCDELLQLTEEQLLNRISGWLYTDEKWWDIIGPGASRYVKADSAIEAKLENQVTH